MVEGEITEVIRKKNGVCPVILHLPSGHVTKDPEQNLTGKLLKSNVSGQPLTVVVDAEDFLFKGEVQEDDVFNSFLLLRNKKTGKARLVEVAFANLSLWHPEQQEKPSQVTQSEYNPDTLNDFNKQFGSKKAKRVTLQRERMKMNVEDAKEALENTVAEIALDESNLLDQKENAESSYCPRINREATSVQEVYSVDDLVPKEVLDSLKEEVNDVLKTETDISYLVPFVQRNILLQRNTTMFDKMKKCKIFLYVHYLTALVLQQAKNITRNYVACKSSEMVSAYILDNFTISSKSGRTRPHSMRDKTICHILVLAMIASDFHLDVGYLAKDLKLGLKKVKDMGRILAFSVPAKSKDVMVLKLPLPAAVSLTPRNNKRKRT